MDEELELSDIIEFYLDELRTFLEEEDQYNSFMVVTDLINDMYTKLTDDEREIVVVTKKQQADLQKQTKKIPQSTGSTEHGIGEPTKHAEEANILLKGVSNLFNEILVDNKHMKDSIARDADKLVDLQKRHEYLSYQNKDLLESLAEATGDTLPKLNELGLDLSEFEDLEGD